MDVSHVFVVNYLFHDVNRLGNLGRATYEQTTNLMWPWSYNHCNRDLQRAQLISACDVTQHYGMRKHQGRGATEIDVIECMSGAKGKLPIVENIERPYVSMTLQARQIRYDTIRHTISYILCTLHFI